MNFPNCACNVCGAPMHSLNPTYNQKRCSEQCREIMKVNFKRAPDGMQSREGLTPHGQSCTDDTEWPVAFTPKQSFHESRLLRLRQSGRLTTKIA